MKKCKCICDWETTFKKGDIIEYILSNNCTIINVFVIDRKSSVIAINNINNPKFEKYFIDIHMERKNKINKLLLNN